MANRRYNRQESVSNGYANIIMKNKIMQAAKAREEGDYSEVQKILDDVEFIFQNETIDLTKATPIINPRTMEHYNRRIEGKNLTELLKRLHSDNFFNSVPGSGFTANSAIEKAIDFNEKIMFSEQGVNTFAAYTDIEKAYNKIQDLKSKGKGSLYLFDTETIGGKNRSNVWNPLGITEFAMQKVDMATGDVTKTNIVLGTADSIENKKKVEKILNALGTSLYDDEVQGEILKKPNLDIILKDEELRVTAYRYGLYGSAGTEFFDSGKGYMSAKKLADANLNDWLDPEKIKRGFLRNVEAYKASPMTEYGINKAQLTFIDAVAEMTKAANTGTGVIGGQNIIPFDFKTVNTEISRMKKNLQEIIDGKIDPRVTKAQAEKGLKYINDAFGNIGGLAAPSENIFDTLPFINIIRDKFGTDALYKGNQKAIMNAASGTAKQENVGAVWFPELFESGDAHRADFDVDVLRSLFTADVKDGQTFIEYFMEGYNGKGLKGENIKAQKILAGGERQLFYAKKGTRDRTFAGKGNLDHTINRKTGEIFFGSNYEIMGPNAVPEFNGEINMGTHINKGQFYYVDSIKKMKTEDVAKNLGATLPELSGPEVFQVRMRMAVGSDYKGKGRNIEDLEFVYHFNSEYELSGWFSSNWDMSAYVDESGKWVINGDKARDLFEQVSLKDGEVIRESGYYLKSPEELIDRTLNAKNKKMLTDKALRDYADPANQYTKIKKQLELRDILSKAGLEGVTEEEIKDLLSNKQIARMNQMDHKKAKQLISDLRDAAGFEPKNKKGTKKLYSNTIEKIASSWDFVSMNDEFYMKVFEDLEKYTNVKNLTLNQQKIMFARVVENAKAQVANQVFESAEDVRKAVYNSKAFEGSLEEVKNVFDIALPDEFIKEQPKIKTVKTGLNFNASNNIVSFRLDNINSSSFELTEKLVKAKYGDRNLRSNPKNYERIATYEFVQHLSTLDDFKDNDNIKKALEHINADLALFDSVDELKKNLNFETNTVSRYIIQAMQDVKEVDPSKGILKDINVRDMEQSEKFVKALNAFDAKDIYKIMEDTPIAIDIPYEESTKMIRQKIETDVLKHYMPSFKEFESTFAGLSEDEIWQKTLLYNTLKEQVTTNLTDLTSALSQVPGGQLYIDESGRFIFQQGEKAVTIDSLTKIKLDGDTLYGQVGRSPVQLHLDIGVNDAGQAYVTTNLGELYEKNKAVTNAIKKRIDDDTFRIEDVLSITSHMSEQFRQDSRYEFKSGDYFTNYMVGTGQVDTLFARMFSENGDLKELGMKVNLSDKEREVLKNAFKNTDKVVEAGEMDPVIRHYTAAYRTEIIRTIAQHRGTEDLKKLVKGLTIGTKGKGKLESDKMMGSNLRFTTGDMNIFDNLGRPVVDGSGNVKFLTKAQLEAAEQTLDGVTKLYSGSLFESAAFSRINNKTLNGVGKVTTGFTSRTAYVGQRGIRAIIENNMDTVLNSNSIAHLNDEQKMNVYNMLKSYLNTFEQQKVFDAKAFDAVTGGTMSANVVKLSSAKDFVNLNKEVKEKYAEQYKRLIDLMGNVEVDKKGNLKYVSTVGDIVRRGETIIPFATYGGETENWTSKMERGLLNFQITNKQGIRLTDEQISQVLNQHKEAFKGVDFKDKKQVLKALDSALEDFEVNFAIEDINRMTLPKILASDSEKSMNHILYAKTGTTNKKIQSFFKAYGKETEELLANTTLTPQALEAYFKDTHKKKVALKVAGFSNWNDFLDQWNKELYTMSGTIFGKGGLFEGFTDIANDNILGHGNKGTMLTGSLDEAISMLGKYKSGSMEETLASRKLGLKEFVKLYNDESGDFQFFKSSKIDPDTGERIGIKLEYKDGHLQLEGGRSFKSGLDDYDFVDENKLEKLIKNIDAYLESQGADRDDRLVHTVKETDTAVVAAKAGEEGAQEYIGRVKYIHDKETGEDIISSVGSTFKKIVNDPETQSSMPQEYYDAKMHYLKLKGEKTNIEMEYEDFLNEYKQNGTISDPERYNYVKGRLSELNVELDSVDEYLKNMETTGHSYRVGEQEQKIIKNYFINDKTTEGIQFRINEGSLSEEAVKANEALRGVELKDYKNREIFAGFLNEIEQQRYYNPYTDSKVLTKNMLKKERYAHLQGIYENLVESGTTNKLGVETAELIHGIQMAELANEFNNRNEDFNKLIKAGFEEMTPDQFIDQFGDPGIDGYEEAIKKNVLLKFDYGGERGVEYVAVPGMGRVLDKAEIKQDWHKYAGRMSRQYQEQYLPLHGNPEKSKELLKKMDENKLKLKKATQEYMTKGTEAHNRSKYEVNAAVDRVKILSLMNTSDSPLLQQAMVDGKSIADWVKEGVYYDYAFDSMEAFERRGFFDDDYLAQVGMSKDEMIKHLRTEGTIMLDDRYPNIRERSVTPVRHYLAVDDKGMSFIANNTVLMSPHTMLAMNADSDGDSVSRFMAKYKNADYVQYNIARSRAIKDVDAAQAYDTDTAREKLIRQQTIQNLETQGFKRGAAAQIYTEYKSQDIKMAQMAMHENKKWQKDVIKTWNSDNKKTGKAMSIRVGDDFSQAEVIGGKSILGQTKLSVLTETPSWETIRGNMDDVNNILDTIKANKEYFTDKEFIKDILEGPSNIYSFENEADVLDRALYAMNILSQDTNASRVKAEGYTNAQDAIIKRIRINKLHEEGMQKLGVTATGNVNSTLYGISQAIKSRHGDVNSPLYDEIMRSITSEVSYLLEETPISGKKSQLKAGDTRLIEFGEVFRDVETKGLTKDTREAMEGYFKKYMDHGQLIDAYNMTMDRIAKPAAERFTKDEDIVNYMVKEYTKFVGQALDKTGPMYEEVQFHKYYGRGGSSSSAMMNAGGKVNSHTPSGRTVHEITGHNTDKANVNKNIVNDANQQNAKNAKNAFTPPPINSIDDSLADEAIETASNTIRRGSKSKIASIANDIIGNGGFKRGALFATVGLAAGLIASGYASGNPLNDPDPATITQKGYENVKAAPEMMFSSGASFAPNNTGGYIINIKGDTRKGNRQLKKALKQATRNAVGPSGIQMEVKTSQKPGAYSDRDIENILSNYF